MIDKVRVFATVEEAIADLSTGVRHHRPPPRHAEAGLWPGGGRPAGHLAHRRRRRAGILFGRERWGLYNEEVALADAIVTFPVEAAFASLNIAQAVLLMCL